MLYVSNTTVDPSPPLSRDTQKGKTKNTTKEEQKKAFLLEAEELMRGATLSLSAATQAATQAEYAVLTYEQRAASGGGGREDSMALAREESKAPATQTEGPNLGHEMNRSIHWHRLKEDAVRQHGIDVKLSWSEKDGAYTISEVVRGGAAWKNGAIHVGNVVTRIDEMPLEAKSAEKVDIKFDPYTFLPYSYTHTYMYIIYVYVCVCIYIYHKKNKSCCFLLVL